MKKFEAAKLKNSFYRVSLMLSQHFLLSFLVSVLIALSLAGFLFYQYSYLADKKEVEISEKSIQFQENLYQKVLAEWQAREEMLQVLPIKQYPDPFR